jgi:hypothetical protein
VDRVDRWLNAQRGWRRLLIGWLVLAPALLDVGLWWSAQGNIDGQATVPTGTVLVHVAIVALVGIPLAAVQVRPPMRRRKSRVLEPGFSWRMIAAMYTLMTSQAVLAYGFTRTLAWQLQHRPYKALFLALAVGGVMLIWNGLYWRKLRRQAEAGAQDSGN